MLMLLVSSLLSLFDALLWIAKWEGPLVVAIFAAKCRRASAQLRSAPISAPCQLGSNSQQAHIIFNEQHTLYHTTSPGGGGGSYLICVGSRSNRKHSILALFVTCYIALHCLCVFESRERKTVITLLKIDEFPFCFLFRNLDTFCWSMSIVWSPHESATTMLLLGISKNYVINRTKS